MKKIVSLFSLLLFFSAIQSADAAVLSAVASHSAARVDETVTVTVVLDTAPESANAVQATLEFSPSVFAYTGDDRTKSVFNFWVQEPTAEEGKIQFVGGTPAGVTGTGLQVVVLKFKAKAAGAALFTLNDAIVTANDGEGTNILKELVPAKVTVGLTVSTPSSSTAVVASSSSAIAEPVVVEIPKPVVRAARPAVKKASAPDITIPLYPDEDRWYRDVGAVTVFWKVPDDVTAVAITADGSSATIPTKYEEDLYDGKNIGELEEGVSYVHVRFKNSEGAGATTHRKIQIDTTPPLPFTIQSSEGAITENPSPVLSFEASDELSGIDHYEVKIDAQDVLIAEEGELELPAQKPGKKVIVVTAVDKAGNTKQWFYNIEILPIKQPTISPFETVPYIGEGNFVVRGTSLPNNIIFAALKNENNEVASETSVVADPSGNWEIVFNDPLKRGSYFLEVVAQDERGASSFPQLSDLFKVRTKPLVVLGGIGITPNVFYTIVILLILTIVGLSGLSYYFWRRQLDRRVIIAQRDVSGAFDSISKDVEEMLRHWTDGKVTKAGLTHIESRLKKVAENVEKLKKYITQNVGSISK